MNEIENTMKTVYLSIRISIITIMSIKGKRRCIMSLNKRFIMRSHARSTILVELKKNITLWKQSIMKNMKYSRYHTTNPNEVANTTGSNKRLTTQWNYLITHPSVDTTLPIQLWYPMSRK